MDGNMDEYMDECKNVRTDGWMDGRWMEDKYIENSNIKVKR